MVRFQKGWKFCFSVLAAIMILATMLVPTPVQAAASTLTVSSTFPIDLVVFVPCANGGAGEYVLLSGPLHDLFHITFAAGGTFTYKFLDNPQGVSGTGQTTGVKYQATGETSNQGSGRVGYEENYVNNFKIIGQGTGNNFLIHENYHLTVNANGTLTAYVDNFSAVCK